MVEDIIVGRDEADLKRFGKEALIYLGKHYVKMGQVTSLSGRIMMDVARAHVVLVAGKRGCLAPETLIFTDAGFKPIKEFDERDKVLSFNTQTKKFEWESAKLLKYSINEKLIKIKFSNGQSLITTSEHPVLVVHKQSLFWKRAEELTTKDKVVMITKVPQVKNDSESLKVARLLGFILTDRSLNRKERWKEFGKYNNGTRHSNIKVKKYKSDCNCEVIETQQNAIKNFVDLGALGNKSKIIRIPSIVWKSSNKFKANFIKALFGEHIDKKGRINYFSASKEFLLDLQLLLKHFDVQSSIKCNSNSHKLSIKDHTSIENFKKIVFNKEKQKCLRNSPPLTKRKRKTRYLSDNLSFLKIDKLSYIDNIKEVYDLTVPKNHSFIANGIISHNSGKSYTLGVIAEEISNLPPEVSQNIGVLIFDTMGIFWTMSKENKKEAALLKEWDMVPKKIPVKVFVPFGYAKRWKEKGIPVDYEFAIKVPDLTVDDWLLTFGLSFTDPVGVVLSRNITKLKESGKDFDLEDLMKAVKADPIAEKQAKDAALNFLEGAVLWGVFASKKQKGTAIKELIVPGQTSVLDLSCYPSVGTVNVRALVIGLICKKLFSERMEARKHEEIEAVRHGLDYLYYKEKREMPMVWLCIDEGHEFLPREGKTAATDALIQLLREGRQPGISLVIATQQPGQIHHDVMTQSDIVISHRVTSKPDIDALNYIMQTYLLESIKTQLDALPRYKGAAIILDDNSERIYPMRVHPRFTWHGGEAPTAVKVKKRL